SFYHTPPPQLYPLSLHDALPISVAETYARLSAPNLARVAEDLVKLLEVAPGQRVLDVGTGTGVGARAAAIVTGQGGLAAGIDPSDRKSTRLNSSHVSISYAVFCL